MKTLFINFGECPENLHFEQTFLKSFKKGENIRFDIVHDFEYDYDFIKQIKNPAGFRKSFSDLKTFKKDISADYDNLIILDFPKREKCSAAFLWLLTAFKVKRKIFILNHLIPMAGHNAAADITEKFKLFSFLNHFHMFKYDDRFSWPKFGVPKNTIVKRDYAVDCDFYKPEKTKTENYILTAGSTGRDFSQLVKAIEKTPFKLKVFSDSPRPKELKNSDKLQWLGFSKNMSKFKETILKSFFIILPLKTEHKNSAAGNSIAFLSMAAGKMVLCKETPYMADFIKDGKNGFFYKTLSPSNLSKQIERIAKLPEKTRENISKEARNTILQKASLQKLIKELKTGYLLNAKS
ncbi:MAG: glycosyltransferase [Elusimicrobiales bacterium]|nr:glycosyltransferase [Elusimicrobiales bacterium]